MEYVNKSNSELMVGKLLFCMLTFKSFRRLASDSLEYDLLK